MSLRVLLAVLLLAILLAAFAVILPSFLFLHDQLSVLFPPNLVTESETALHTLLAAQIIGTVTVLTILLAGLFWILQSLVARPLKGIVIAMDAFAERGEKLPLPALPPAPSELRKLVSVFGRFVDRVDEAHKKDVEVSRVKSDFISTAAHQLRTPLTGIRWALEALEMSDLSEEHKALVKSATDKSHELVAIVGTLLDISSIESGKYKYAFAPVDLESVAEEVVNDFMPLAQKSKVTLYVEKSGGVVPKVKADRQRIKWILNNLIENAIRYTPADGSVRIMSEQKGSQVYLRVRDTGIGIGAEDKDNIFERFYRAQNAIAVQNGGNGLGLYIARTIATDHGGDLTFASNTEGHGTTFTLSLPVV